MTSGSKYYSVVFKKNRSFLLAFYTFNPNTNIIFN